MSPEDQVVWWTAFGAIAQALGAVATFAAVGVTLWVVRTERALAAAAHADIFVTFAGDGSPGIYHVGIVVENVGIRPIKVTSVGWRTGWLRRAPFKFRHRYAVANPAPMVGGDGNFPSFIEPSHKKTFLIPIASFQASSDPQTRQDFFKRSFLGIQTPIRLLIDISGRNALVSPVSPRLAQFLRTGVYAETTADDDEAA